MSLALVIILLGKILILSATIKYKDINRAILLSVLILVNIGNILTRINSVLFKNVLVDLTNELLICNSAWGK